jgi:hypothetical protein
MTDSICALNALSGSGIGLLVVYWRNPCAERALKYRP